ncbi:ABC transporter ATP-binding protein [Streptomyces goshikiensis]|uniref:ABC transporter ATP-binding protein n=1 Tax=Streptomyces goshikiensis TaxID=1942 RepID=UPI0022F407DF|nr:ABC transporter ATP-binding protein [Streptomyces goshikiensis]WBY20088.1 ABC transporter ATP-binding protein [Streptomyces goshikiensis]
MKQDFLLEEPTRAPVRRIVRLFHPYRGRLLIVVALIAGASVIALTVPLMVRELFDTALPQGRTGLLSALALGMSLASITGSAISVLESYISTSVGQRVMHDLRSQVYSHLQELPLAFFTRTRTGEVQSRIANDIGAMQATVTSTVSSLVSSLTTVIASAIALLIMDWRLAVLSFSVLPLFILISRRVGELRRIFVRRRQRQMASMSSMVEERLSVSGILLSRTMGRSKELSADFIAESQALCDLQVQSSMAGRWRQSVIQMIMSLMPVLIYWSSGMTAARGHAAISLGTLIAFVSLQQGLFGPTLSLLGVGVALQGSMALFERVFEYLDLPKTITEPEVPVQLADVQGNIRFEAVDFSYGDVPTLSGIDITVPAGGSLAVVGETGAGKTTIGYLVARLYDVTGGRITLDGVDLRELGSHTLTSSIGVVSQETYLFHASIADNLRFAKPEATDQELVDAAKAAQIHHLIEGLPDSYDTVVGQRGLRMSGGERQRIAIARTLLRNPPVLVLDEATSALDSQTERSVQRALDTLAAGRTVITIAHRLSTTRDADEIVVLEGGRIAERGSHDDLLLRGGTYASMFLRGSRTDEKQLDPLEAGRHA